MAVRSALLYSHLADLKEITHDFHYENYRTEKLSKAVQSHDAGSGGYSGAVNSDGSLDPQSLASQSVRLKEEQLRREEEKLREIEIKVQREINEKRQELLARESQLKELESRMVGSVSRVETFMYYYVANLSGRFATRHRCSNRLRRRTTVTPGNRKPCVVTRTTNPGCWSSILDHIVDGCWGDRRALCHEARPWRFLAGLSVPGSCDTVIRGQNAVISDAILLCTLLCTLRPIITTCISSAGLEPCDGVFLLSGSGR